MTKKTTTKNAHRENKADLPKEQPHIVLVSPNYPYITYAWRGNRHDTFCQENVVHVHLLDYELAPDCPVAGFTKYILKDSKL